MAKKTKKVKKIRKIKVVPILLTIVLLVGMYYFLVFLLLLKIQNIYIYGNEKLKDDYIIKLAKVESYPSFLKTLNTTIKKNVLKDPYIKEVSVKKTIRGELIITIVENDILFYRENDKKYILEDEQEVDTVPYLSSYTQVINFIPDLVYDNFINKYLKIDKDVRVQISQIKYDPSEYDDNRFLLFMKDGNYIYINTNTLVKLNYYQEIYPTLDNKKGILYLDSGNHFQELK